MAVNLAASPKQRKTEACRREQINTCCIIRNFSAMSTKPLKGLDKPEIAHKCNTISLFSYYDCSALNPVIYGFMCKSFRESFRKTMCRCFGSEHHTAHHHRGHHHRPRGGDAHGAGAPFLGPAGNHVTSGGDQPEVRGGHHHSSLKTTTSVALAASDNRKWSKSAQSSLDEPHSHLKPPRMSGPHYCCMHASRLTSTGSPYFMNNHGLRINRSRRGHYNNPANSRYSNVNV